MVVTVALYTMPLARHAPSRGQEFLFLQLQPSELALRVSFRILALCCLQLPKSISTRISSLFCNSEEFNKASTIYNDALKSSGYKEGISYTKSRGQNVGKRKNRPRNIIWFNPPFSADIETNVAKTFLKLIDKHFPKLHILHKVFNRNNVKVSYSCTSNMCNLIKQHKYIWELKDKRTDHEIKWSTLKRAKPYSGKPSRCHLCLAEKLCILTADMTSPCCLIRDQN